MMVVTLLTFLSRRAQVRPVCCVPTPRAPTHRPVFRFISMASIRLSMLVLIAVAALRLTSATAAEARHAIAMHGEPALADGFKAFNYVDPAAPAGGRLVQGVLGTFDSLNPLIVKGLAVQSIRGYVIEGLMTRGYDEPFTLYGLIAKTVETDAARSYVTFTLDPRARFSAERPQLPGQDVPGLGLAQESSELLVRMAVRLGLSGLVFRPAAYHLAWAGRGQLRFLDPARQGRFEALAEALAGMTLLDATRAVMEGRVLMNGEPYAWEPDEMVRYVEPRDEERAAVEAEKARSRFELR